MCRIVLYNLGNLGMKTISNKICDFICGLIHKNCCNDCPIDIMEMHSREKKVSHQTIFYLFIFLLFSVF